MEQQEKGFQVTVQINQGLEPTTFTIIPEGNLDANPQNDTTFKITRDKDKDVLAVLTSDTNHGWTIISGELEQQDADAIGAAIDAHTA